ncbi:MAG: hypothetical protein JNL72_01575 [Flavipsychrobacter sp.]|nr:hypothetical protein [Flavipsychrobacter sp.]
MTTTQPLLLLSMPSGGELLIALLVCGLFLIPFILYLLTLQNTLKLISPQNRKMEPSMVWLMFIPFFNMVWHFIIVNRLADSLQDEYRHKAHPAEPRPTYNMGLAMCILFCCTWIPLLGGLVSLGALIVWILYWVQVSGHRSKLQQLQFSSGGDSQIF